MTNLLRPCIAVLIAAHNRRELTVRALQALQCDESHFSLKIVIYDDGSNDGTASAVKAVCPDAIILQGTGDAYWNGAMNAAWSYALSLHTDGYLWLNDDVRLDEDALPRLAHEWHRLGGAQSPFIIVGATCDENGLLSYGGQKRIFSPFGLKFKQLPISETYQQADTFNGNIVLISHATVERIGINDPKFLHSLGDLDYGLRATYAKIPIYVLPRTAGVCNKNPPKDLSALSVRERWRYFTSAKGLPLRSWSRFTRRYSGLFYPVHLILPYRKIFFSNAGRDK